MHAYSNDASMMAGNISGASENAGETARDLDADIPEAEEVSYAADDTPPGYDEAEDSDVGGQQPEDDDDEDHEVDGIDDAEGDQSDLVEDDDVEEEEDDGGEQGGDESDGQIPRDHAHSRAQQHHFQLSSQPQRRATHSGQQPRRHANEQASPLMPVPGVANEDENHDSSADMEMSI